MTEIPNANELLDAKLNEWRRRIDNYVKQNSFFREDDKGALLFEITPELITLLIGFKCNDLKNRKLIEEAHVSFREYIAKYSRGNCIYDVKIQFRNRSGTSNAKPYFVATAIRI
jgi:hypothetical protein